MRHIYIRIYAFIAILSVLFVVGVFVFHIVDDINNEIENAKITFNKFEKAIAYEVKNSLLEDETSRQRLRSVAKALDIKGFVVQIAPNVGRVFSYPSDSSLFSIVNGNVLIKEHSKFLKVFKTEGIATIEDVQQKIYITVMINIFPSDMLFIRSRTVFFFALALMLLTGLVRILLSIKPSEKVEKVYTTFSGKPEQNAPSYGSYEPTSPVSFFEKESTLNKDNLNAININETKTVQDQDDLSDVVYSDDKSSFTPSNITFNDLKDEPRGLYSPTTGFGWQEYLTERLDAELARSSSIDQDMSFVIIKIQDIDFSSLNMENISSILLDAFTFKDMVFEYSNDTTLGFAGILQDMYIDDALKICDSLFSKMRKEIYLTGQEPTIGIGITTRACRLATAKIIINEAEAAVSRGLKNKNDPIVGFRPSAEKYRQQAIEERD